MIGIGINIQSVGRRAGGANSIASILASRGGFWAQASGIAASAPPTIDSWTPQAQGVTAGSFVQATAAFKPDIEVVNGLNTAQFDTDEHLKSDAPAASWNWLHAAAGSSIFVVWRRTGGAGTQTLLDTSNGNVNNHGVSLTISATNVLSARVSNGSGVALFTASLDFDSWGGSIASMSIAELVWSEAGGYELRVDGGTGVRLVSGSVTGSASSSNAMGSLALGVVTAASTQWLFGNIAEPLAFIGPLTEPERVIVRAELAAKHAVVLQA